VNVWLIARIGACVAALFDSYFFVREMPGNFAQRSWPFFFEMVGLSAFAMIFLRILSKVNPWGNAIWGPPSWYSSLVTLRSPLQIFHLGAWCFIALGVGCMVLGMAQSPKNWIWQSPFSAGVGVLLGVHLVKSAKPGR
jgi:hypothetical protein